MIHALIKLMVSYKMLKIINIYFIMVEDVMDGVFFLHLKIIIRHLVTTFIGTIFFIKCQGDDHWAHLTPHPLV